jgi:CheY-like chemotaxis protein
VKTILVVEDDGDTFNVIWDLLRDEGYFVVGATNGQEGLEQAMLQSPDLLVCDLRMPVLSGVEMVRAIRADPRYRHLPLVAVSAAILPDGALDGLFDAFLPKPFDLPELLDVIARALSKTG